MPHESCRLCLRRFGYSVRLKCDTVCVVVMDVRGAVADYVARMVKAVHGVKALVLDDETARIIGVVCSQSELFRQDVFLTERLGTEHAIPVSHLSAIVFIRPTAENVRALQIELQSPSFGSYHIFFSNITRHTYIEDLANADEMHSVCQVHEHFADFYALDAHLFSFQVSPCLDAILGGVGAAMANPNFDRTVDGIAASLLSLKRKPVVRFQGSSSLCRNLAERVAVRMDQEASLYGFREHDPPPLLLILDRREDPVTPLLNQWTYEAMIHELIGAENNRVSLEKAPNVPEDLRNVVLDASTDDFFRQNRFQNFGELGINLKTLVDSFHDRAQSNSNLASIEDMMRFVGSYPEFRKTMSNVSKHVAISSELSRLVEKHNLLQVSQLEQDIACREAESDHRREVTDMLRDKKVTASDKLRLVMLYSLRYELTTNIRKSLTGMIEELHASGVGSDGVHLIASLRDYAGAKQRSGDLFSNQSILASFSSTVRRGIGGVENVYTQHEPLLAYTLDDLLRGRLKVSEYPTAQGGDTFGTGSLLGGPSEHGSSLSDTRGIISSGNPNLFIRPPREVIVIIAGGVTFEESKCVSGINGGRDSFRPPEGSTTASAAVAAKQSRSRIVLGGSTVTNSNLFAVEIARYANALSAESTRQSDHVF